MSSELQKCKIISKHRRWRWGDQEKIRGQLKAVSLHAVSQKSLKCLLNYSNSLCSAALTTKTISSFRSLWRLIEAAKDILILILSKTNIISLNEKNLKKVISKFSELTRGCKEMNAQKKFLKFCIASSCISHYHICKVIQLCTRNRYKVNLEP